MKVKQKDLETQPKLSEFLSDIEGGKDEAFKAMRFSSTPLIQSFLEKYDALPKKDRETVPLEAIALHAKVNVPELLGEILFAMRSHSVSKVKFIAVASHPKVMKKRVEYAQLPGGSRDRDALDTILGALPSPKGISIINKMFGVKEDAEDEPETPERSEDDMMEFAFPDPEKMQERLLPIRQKALAE